MAQPPRLRRRERGASCRAWHRRLQGGPRTPAPPHGQDRMRLGRSPDDVRQLVKVERARVGHRGSVRGVVLGLGTQDGTTRLQWENHEKAPWAPPRRRAGHRASPASPRGASPRTEPAWRASISKKDIGDKRWARRVPARRGERDHRHRARWARGEGVSRCRWAHLCPPWQKRIPSPSRYKHHAPGPRRAPGGTGPPAEGPSGTPRPPWSLARRSVRNGEGRGVRWLQHFARPLTRHSTDTRRWLQGAVTSAADGPGVIMPVPATRTGCLRGRHG